MYAVPGADSSAIWFRWPGQTAAEEVPDDFGSRQVFVGPGVFPSMNFIEHHLAARRSSGVDSAGDQSLRIAHGAE